MAMILFGSSWLSIAKTSLRRTSQKALVLPVREIALSRFQYLFVALVMSQLRNLSVP